MKLANTIGSVYNYTTSPADAVRLHADTGFRHLDFSFYDFYKKGHPFLSDDWMAQIKDAEKAAQQSGFDFVQGHAPGANFMDDNTDPENTFLSIVRSIEASDYLGIRNLVIHTGSCANILYPNGRGAYFRRNREYLERLVPYLEKFNVNLLVENSAEKNMGNRYFLMTAQEMVDFVREFDHPLVHICWDVGHANMRGTNPYTDITTLGSELYALHIQDNYGVNDDHTAPFMGTLNIDAVMQGLQDIGYNGYFTFEADNILRPMKAWPHKRRVFDLPRESRLQQPSAELIKETLCLLYSIGKHILTQYDCMEE